MISKLIGRSLNNLKNLESVAKSKENEKYSTTQKPTNNNPTNNN